MMKSGPSGSPSRWTTALVFTLCAASAVLSTSMGVRQSLGLFLDPIVRGAGVSVAAFGLAMAIQNLAWGLFQPVMGALSDRYGGRQVVIVSALAFAAGLIALSSGSILGLYLGGGLLIGLAVAGTSHGVLVGIISRVASPTVRPIAVAALAATGSLGTFIVAPVSQVAIETINWRPTLIALAAVVLAMAAIASALKPAGNNVRSGSGEQPDPRAAIRQAFTHPGYIAMTVAFFACGFQLIFIATHLPKYLALCGLPPSVGAHAIALIGISNAIGTLAIGYLGERFGNRQMLALIYLLRTAVIVLFVLLPTSVESTLLFALSMGALWLSVIPPVSALITSMFGATNFGALFGVMFMSHQVGAFLGAWLGGLTFDVSGGYNIAWAALIVVGLLAAAMQIRMDDTPRVQSSLAT